jgi:hypothetical protein
VHCKRADHRRGLESCRYGNAHAGRSSSSPAGRLLTALMVGGFLALILGVGVGMAVPAHADESARGIPDNCAQLPWGTAGCEEYLGARVRADLLAAGYPAIPNYTDWELGRTAMSLCENGVTPPELGNRLLLINAAIAELPNAIACG